MIFRGRVWGGGKCPAHVKYKRCCDFISARRYGSSAVRRMVAMHSTHEDRQHRNFCLSDMAHSTIHLEWHSLSALFPNFSCKVLLKTTSFFLFNGLRLPSITSTAQGIVRLNLLQQHLLKLLVGLTVSLRLTVSFYYMVIPVFQLQFHHAS